MPDKINDTALATTLIGQTTPIKHLIDNGSTYRSDGALLEAATLLESELPSSPEPKLLSVLLDDSESDSALLIISELLLVDIFLPMRGMMCFPFDELID